MDILKRICDPNFLPEKIEVGRAKNLTNMNIDSLHVLYRVNQPSGSNVKPSKAGAFGLTLCECGRYEIKSSSYLISPSSKEFYHACSVCTHYKYKPNDLVGPYHIKLLSFAGKTGKETSGIFECPQCKQKFQAQINNIVSGHTTKCPDCVYQESLKYNVGDFLGKNKHFFLKELDRNKFNRRMGEFICGNCGRHFLADVARIGGNFQKSCGCLSPNYSENLTGNTYGQLVVLAKNGIAKNGEQLGLCQCSCGNTTNVRAYNLKNGLTISCGCFRGSKGEKRIANLLLSMNINYEIQKRFSNCKNKYPLPFDFYLPDYNCCIEYDGEQHFIENTFFHTSLSERQYLDSIKNQYCEENGIKLIRIPYGDFDLLNEEYLKTKIVGDS